MKNSFTAIDFETAQGKHCSICQVGLVRVENQIITEQLSILVQPPDNYYWKNYIDIHGITPEQTANASTFDVIWKQIEPFIKNQNVVAHHGFDFDFPILTKTLEYYGIQPPEYNKFCTYSIYKSNLAKLCKEFDIQLDDYDALSCARACSTLFKLHLNK